ncbi:MAG: hypothetical protein JWP91_2694 [Fibrobacteres bacterium]|nr:hypothetical protein [Fibrobacterota bacterium]
MLAYRKIDFDALAAGARPFYTPNVFIRIGLFIFGYICALAVAGLIFLVMDSWHSQKGSGAILMVYGAGLFAAVEGLIRRRKPFFRAGLEEVLLYGGLSAILSGLFQWVHLRHGIHYPMALFMGCLFAVASLRYADSLLAAASLGMGFYALFDAGAGMGPRAGYLLPLLVVALSCLIVLAAARALATPSLRYWTHVWTALRFLTLMTCYAGGNYFAVREGGRALFGGAFDVTGGVPYAPLFYGFTFAIPILYVAVGLARKDRLCLRAGLLCVALAVLTYKKYHSVMPIETGLTLLGLALIAIAWAALRLFRTERFGITAGPQTDMSGAGLMDAESLALLQSLASRQAAPPQAPGGLEGGGGSFGGGGAGGKF